MSALMWYCAVPAAYHAEASWPVIVRHGKRAPAADPPRPSLARRAAQRLVARAQGAGCGSAPMCAAAVEQARLMPFSQNEPTLRHRVVIVAAASAACRRPFACAARRSTSR